MQPMIEFEKSIFETIKGRRSVRTYQRTRIEEKRRQLLQQAADKLGNEVFRFAWFERESNNLLAERIGTYGVIKGAGAFLAGIIQKNAIDKKEAAIHFGYAFEQMILKATEIGLGTCWLGGTFNPAVFAGRVGPGQDEKIVMLTPIGTPAAEKHLISRITSKTANSSTRKAWGELFFDGGFSTSLSEEKAGVHAPALEMVRLAPSSVNSQPWRVIRTESGFHFFAAATNYFALGKEGFLRYNDMGIAMAHFEIACREMKLKGNWIIGKQAEPLAPNIEYIQTWEEEEK
jgi:nitroreductase